MLEALKTKGCSVSKILKYFKYFKAAYSAGLAAAPNAKIRKTERGRDQNGQRQRAGIPGRAHLLTTHSAAQVLTGKRPASGQEAAKTDSRKGVISN